MLFAWLVGLEAPQAAVERQDALRNGAALAQLAVSDGLIAGDERGHGQLAIRLGELRRDGWLSLDWQAMPPPGDEEPTVGRMYQAAHLQRMDNIRLSPQGLVAHAARASSSPIVTTAPAASIMHAAAATAPDDELRDAFISHAGEDKEEVARPLTEALKHLGRSVWFDEAELVVGDSLSSSIDRGLATSRFGVVVLSEHFFAKNWPLRELQGLVAREMAGGERLILPVWHRIDAQYLAGVAPPLADLVAADTSDGIRVVAERISAAIGRRRAFESARGRPMPARRAADAPPDREQELAPHCSTCVIAWWDCCGPMTPSGLASCFALSAERFIPVSSAPWRRARTAWVARLTLMSCVCWRPAYGSLLSDAPLRCFR